MNRELETFILDHVRQGSSFVFEKTLRTAITYDQARLAKAAYGPSRFLLGHRDLEETTIYLYLSIRHLSATARPLDSLVLAGNRDLRSTK